MSAIEDTRLAVPGRRAFLSPDEVEALVRPLRQTIALLEERLAVAQKEAAAEERVEQGAGADPAAAVDEALASAASMRAAAELDAARRIALARDQAATRVAAARDEARAILARCTPAAGVASSGHVPAPVIVEGPSMENTWRVGREPATAAMSLTSWIRVELFLPMVAAVMVMVVVLAWMG